MRTDKISTSGLFEGLGRRLRREDGFSMISAMMALIAGMTLSFAAWTTANTSIRVTGKDRYAKQAYQVAQSGVSDYVQRLANDPNVWQECDGAGIDKRSYDPNARAGFGVTAVNDTIYGSAYDTAYSVASGGHPSRRWLPWATGDSTDNRAFKSQYTIDLLPSNGFTSCAVNGFTADIATSRIVNNSTGTFRIRVTGRAGPPVPDSVAPSEIESWRASNWRKVSLVVEFRRAAFLDYTYFTNHEAIDPNLFAGGRATWEGVNANRWSGADQIKMGEKCNDFYRHSVSGATAGRESLRSPTRNILIECSNERPLFNAESINGPVHTNDSFRVESLGTDGTMFGNARKGDRIEVYDSGQSGANCAFGQITGGCACPFRVDITYVDSYQLLDRICSKTARMNTGTLLVTGPDAEYIEMPKGNEDLKSWAGRAAPAGYLYTGPTRIQLNSDSTITITNAGATRTVAYPPNGVIYVQNDNVGNCDSDPNADYKDPIRPGGMGPRCALVEVRGTYNKSLTIGSQADVVITGNVQRAAGTYALLGLVAQNYVRLRHFPAYAGDFNRQSVCTLTPGDEFFGAFQNYMGCIGQGTSNLNDALGNLSNLFNSFLDWLDGKPVSTTVCAAESNSVAGTPPNFVQASVLALRRSFTLDSAQCGAQIPSTLNINGAITQNWRGALTATDWRAYNVIACTRNGDWWHDFLVWVEESLGRCGGSFGYKAKVFNYDYLMRALTPPHFLEPQESSWRINRIRQTVPACACGPTG